jgi:hypothetical protein
MAMVTPWPSVRQALIRQLRSNFVLAAELSGDWSEGFAPQKTPYPLGVLSLHYAPSMYDWSGVVSIIGVDVFVYAKDQGQAASLDQLVFTTLQDAKLVVAGQTSLMCRRSSSISLQDVDAEGKAVYQCGGVYEIRVAQTNPTLRVISFHADSTIA